MLAMMLEPMPDPATRQAWRAAKPQETRDSVIFSATIDRGAAVRPGERCHDHRHGCHVMPGAMPVARVTPTPTRHGRDKPPKVADSLGFRRQVKLTKLHLLLTRRRHLGALF
jgi:hypothetical protein